jgi:hypothetical protein
VTSPTVTTRGCCILPRRTEISRASESFSTPALTFTAWDLHKGEVIGWAAGVGNESVINLLVARGARHHIFSAIALNDLALVEKLVEEDPESLARRRSRFEDGETPVHSAFAPPDGLGGKPNYAMLELRRDVTRGRRSISRG